MSEEHPRIVKQGLTRVVALIAVLVMGAGGRVECAGWQPAPEARMACCAEGDACPMHRSGASGPDSTASVSQTEADRCCAASESDNSTPPASSLAMTVPPAPLAAELFAFVPSPAVPRDFWRESVPLAGSQVPRHLLLSVFLI